MDKQLSVKLPPSLTAETSVKIWEQVLGAESSGQTIFDASDLTFCDESGLTLLYERMSPEERAEMEKERERLGWEPVTSQKYEVIVK